MTRKGRSCQTDESIQYDQAICVGNRHHRRKELHQQLIHPDILIYLHAPVKKLQENIKKRQRDYEQSIADDYLFNIQETYTSYIKQHNMKTLFIDASNADFINNQQHVNVILNALEQDFPHGQHYFSLP